MHGTPLDGTGEVEALVDVGELEEGEGEVLEGVGLEEEGLDVLVGAEPLEGELDELDEGLEEGDVPNIPHGDLYRDVTSVWLR